MGDALLCMHKSTRTNAGMNKLTNPVATILLGHLVHVLGELVGRLLDFLSGDAPHWAHHPLIHVPAPCIKRAPGIFAALKLHLSLRNPKDGEMRVEGRPYTAVSGLFGSKALEHA
eukprot:349632-Chlamydomonas_euryale.AAC.29